LKERRIIVAQNNLNRSLQNTHNMSVEIGNKNATENMPWVEKYRPNHFDDIVLDPLNRVFFQNIIEKQQFSNLLFYGPPGTGKTTTIINLINEYQTRHFRKNKESVIHLNASDERGIDIIRTQIYQFVKSKHIFEVGTKFVILDEVDYMTKNAQQALKTLLQTTNMNVRFCLICNYISKIDESLQHEFICVRFNQLPKLEIHRFIRAISDKEGIDLSDESIDMIREMHQSDIRSMINFLQSTGTKQVVYPIISPSEWKTLHHSFSLSFVNQLSIRYNLSKKNIIHQYLNYVIRKHPRLITKEWMNMVEQVVHADEDLPVSNLIQYIVLHGAK